MSETLSSSFTLLYCPFKDGCDYEEPTDNPYKILTHLKEAHNISISNPESCFPFFDRYLITIPERASLSQEDFDRLDHGIRIRLQTDRLREILELQERERSTLYKKPVTCLFCSHTGETLSDAFQHMFYIHKFNIGQLENLISVPQFIELLRAKLAANTCIFCEEILENHTELFKHLKLRQHFKVHPKNKAYDRFYISNYLSLNNPQSQAKSSMDDEEEDEDKEWSGLNEPEDEKTSCLFCSEIYPSVDELLVHLGDKHSFSLKSLLKELDFYKRIQYVNCLRYHQRLLKCPNCLTEFDSEEKWSSHFVQLPDHCKCKESLWNEAQFIFPAFNENDDPLLFSLDFDEPETEV
jgi:hypothetical protein